MVLILINFKNKIILKKNLLEIHTNLIFTLKYVKNNQYLIILILNH